MAGSWLESAHGQLERAVAGFLRVNGAPGAVAVAGTMDAAAVVTGGVIAPGYAEVSPSASTRYDVASLTKVVATWPLTGMAIADGILDLDKPMSSYFGSATYPGSVVTTRQILCHTSGMRAVTQLDQYLGRDKNLADLILGEELDAEPGTTHVYINRGFILLGLLLERIFGARLDVLARDRVWCPWGLCDTGFGPMPATAAVAPTEHRLPGARPVWGVVHDENAALLGGTAGHAGVFSTADDLVRFCRAVLTQAGSDSPFGRYVRESVREQAADHQTRRGLAWLISPHGDVVYHHGFTGVSLYLAPAGNRFIALLSNAIHLSRDGRRRIPLRSTALRLMTLDVA